ncbi:hypothetical protein CAPTEDRAFT_223578 [Capitella teleta]|uniref:Uncharacterized protein n=1 Tax=Capitella teleta TaxID=283909 RepID=R7V0B2_CAPTE|nr:hypothetical protein CAPTEDRAFT_223578 [Capitella teleta]|eukprot:ELU09101.1 hypothetical protein CAPTEDRAFT_223578 [Capitella teleta]
MSASFLCTCPNVTDAGICGSNLIRWEKLVNNCTVCGWSVCLEEVLRGDENFVVCLAEFDEDGSDATCRHVTSKSHQFCPTCGMKFKVNVVKALETNTDDAPQDTEEGTKEVKSAGKGNLEEKSDGEKKELTLSLQGPKEEDENEATSEPSKLKEFEESSSSSSPEILDSDDVGQGRQRLSIKKQDAKKDGSEDQAGLSGFEKTSDVSCGMPEGLSRKRCNSYSEMVKKDMEKEMDALRTDRESSEQPVDAQRTDRESSEQPVDAQRTDRESSEQPVDAQRTDRESSEQPVDAQRTDRESSEQPVDTSTEAENLPDGELKKIQNAKQQNTQTEVKASTECGTIHCKLEQNSESVVEHPNAKDTRLSGNEHKELDAGMIQKKEENPEQEEQLREDKNDSEWIKVKAKHRSTGSHSSSESKKLKSSQCSRSPDNESCIATTFHVVLSKKEFGFNPEFDKLYVRFEPIRHLGGFNPKDDARKWRLEICRRDNKLLYLAGIVDIPKYLLRSTISYKYVMEKVHDSDCWEKLGPNPNQNRLLHFPLGKIEKADSLHQCDGLITRNEPEGFVRRQWNSLFSSPDKIQDKFNRSIILMLPSLKDVRQEGSSEKGHAFILRFRNICDSLYFNYGSDANHVLKFPLKLYVEGCIDALTTHGQTSKRRIVAALVLVNILATYKVSISMSHAQKLCRALLISCGDDKDLCHDWEEVQMNFAENFERLKDDLSHFVKYLIYDLELVEMVFTLPLLHFLFCLSQPFKLVSFENHRTPEWWGFPSNMEHDFQCAKYLKFKSEKLPQCVQELKPLFHCDLLLSRSLLAIWTNFYDSLASLTSWGIFPLDALLANALYFMYKYKQSDRGLETALHQFTILVSNSYQNNKGSWTSQSPSFLSVLGLGLEIIEIAVSNHIEVAPTAFSLVLTLLSFDTFEEKACLEQSTQRVLGALYKFVNGKRPRFHTDYGFAGIAAKFSMSNQKKEYQEMNINIKYKDIDFQITRTQNRVIEGSLATFFLIWGIGLITECKTSSGALYAGALRSVKCAYIAPDADCNTLSDLLTINIASGKLQQIWTEAISEILLVFLNELKNHVFMELYCDHMEWEKYHREIETVFNKVLLLKLDTYLQGSSDHLFAMLRSSQSEKLAVALSHFLVKCWPRGESDVELLDFVLSWPALKQYLSCFIGSQSLSREEIDRVVLNPDCQERLAIAVSLLEKISKGIRNGGITLKELEIILTHQLRFIELLQCDRSSATINIKEVDAILNRRKHELEFFKNFRKQVNTLVALFKEVNPKCMANLEIQLQQPVDTMHIETIYELRLQDDQPIVMRFLTLDDKLVNVLSDLNHLVRCRLFYFIWKEMLRTSQAPLKSVDSILCEVWEPAVSAFRSLSSEMKSGIISLYHVSHFFNGISLGDTMEDLSFMGLEEETAKHRAKQMEHFFHLKYLHKGATLITECKEVFALKGDFTTLQNLIDLMEDAQDQCLDAITEDMMEPFEEIRHITDQQNQALQAFIKSERTITWLRNNVKGNKELKVLVDLALMSAKGQGDHDLARMEDAQDQCLDAITEDMMEPFEEIRHITDQQNQALQAFIKSERTITWLRNNVKGNKELKVLVDLALMSAKGQGDHDLARVRCLQTAVIGYSPLIYNMKTSDGLREFLFHCKALFASLESDKTIPRKMSAICFQGREDCDLNCVMKLHLKIAGAKSLLFSYQKLRDLQSKIMLVAGEAEVNTGHIEMFTELFDAIVRYSQIYVELCNSGCLLFKKWKTMFFCEDSYQQKVHITLESGAPPLKGSSEKLKDQVIVISDFMETCLREWREYIGNCRQKHYSLNYFSTRQLVYLCEHLACVEKDHALDKGVLPLLQAVLPGCTLEDALTAVKAAFREIAGAEKIKVSDMPPLEGEEDDLESRFRFALLEAGFDDVKAAAAFEAVGPNIDEGLMWCMDNSEDDLESDEEMEFVECAAYERGKTMKAMTTDMLKGIDQSEGLGAQLMRVWASYLECISTSFVEYLSIDHLGFILEQLFSLRTNKFDRSMPVSLQKGSPNLVVLPSNEVLPAVLSLYIDQPHLPLPAPDEVLMCTEATSAEEVAVELIWLRAIGDVRDGRQGKIYCLANAQLLKYTACEKLEQCLLQFQSCSHDYSLVVICSEIDQDQSHTINILQAFRRPFPFMHSVDDINHYLKTKFCEHAVAKGAWMADKERSSVRIIKSLQAGVGKSTRVLRMHETAKRKFGQVEMVTVSLHERSINIDNLVDILLENMKTSTDCEAQIVHVDLSHAVQRDVDHVLFNMLVLGSLCHSSGRMWSKRPHDLYLVECLPLQKPNQNNTRSNLQYLHAVLGLLPALICWSPEDSLRILRKDFEDIERLYPGEKISSQLDQLMDQKLFQSKVYQKPYYYLSTLHKQKFANTPEQCIEILLQFCGLRDPSWAELYFFASFLHEQLKLYENCVFCSPEFADDLPGFQEFVLKFLIQMSKDFATRSLTISEQNPAKMQLEGGFAPDLLQDYSLKRTWESRPHPYLFFNADDSETVTFLGFHIDASTGNAVDPLTLDVIERNVMSNVLQHVLHKYNVPLRENFDTLTRLEKINKLCQVMGLTIVWDPDQSYELTNDNVKKILAIHMRFRCGIPVIIMGETGCGKTRLIKFLCDLHCPPGVQLRNMILLKVHGGTTKSDLKKALDEAMRTAKSNRAEYGFNICTVLFLDEANTTHAVGSIKEILCDRHFDGKPIPSNTGLSIVAACNPYRKHNDAMIERLEKAGLGYRVRADETADTFGATPLRQLVYRVQPLPLSLLPLVWDFGQLDLNTEKLYIRQMVHHSLNDPRVTANFEEIIVGVLLCSQSFMREQENEVSFVSLRDVERVLRVFVWFLQQDVLMEAIEEAVIDEEENSQRMHDVNPDDDSDDEQEEQELPVDKMTRALILALGVCYHSCLEMETRAEYRDRISDEFHGTYSLSPGSILTELNRCQNVILDGIELDGNIARNQALKENVFMMVVCIELRIPLFLVGKPGSSKSLAKTIVEDAMQGEQSRNPLFRSFKHVHMISFQCSQLSTPDGIMATFQECAQLQKDKNLEEFVSVVVLDEIGLAEDSPKMPLKTLHPLLEDGCVGHEEPEPHRKVAFIGISNWALDPAKMNRGILVQRGVPDGHELENSARGICGDDKTRGLIQHIIGPIAKSYSRMFDEAVEKCKEEFFGLRDFYGLIKAICRCVKRSQEAPTNRQLRRAILQNFGGLDTVNPLEVFSRTLEIDLRRSAGDTIDCSPLALIEENLNNCIASNSESRYLLVLTENYAALGILQQQLAMTRDAVIIFGSSFPKDLDYTQVCRNINRIKICMETGRTVILLNLENLYESLYDALNQYYVYLGGERFVDLGLGNQRVKCKVHEKFRLLVVAEKNMVYKRFPIPLINRLEKHFLSTGTLLQGHQQRIYEELSAWVQRFIKNSSRVETYQLADVFIGFHEDTIASIILQICQEHDVKEDNIAKVVQICKERLLLTATPDSILRLGKSSIEAEEAEMLWKVYFDEQRHASLKSFLSKQLDEAVEPLFGKVTTYGPLPAESDRRELADQLDIPLEDLVLMHLKKFDTEQQFYQEVIDYKKQEPSSDKGCILMVLCDAGQHNSKLIACAQHILFNERMLSSPFHHILVIVQLSRSSLHPFVGFSGSQWFNFHLDELSEQNDELAPLRAMQDKAVSSLLQDEVKVNALLLRCVHSTVGMIQDSQNSEIKIRRVDILLQLLDPKGNRAFVEMLKKRLHKAIKENEEDQYNSQPTRWLADQVAHIPTLRKTGTLRCSIVHYLEERLSKFLAQIVACLDTNCNLSLLLPQLNPKWKRELWMNIFRDESIDGLDVKREFLHGNAAGVSNQFVAMATGSFAAQIPFSWLIKEKIDQIMLNKATIAGAVSDVETLFMESAVGQRLAAFVEVEGLLDAYAHDYVRMVYRPQSACPAEEYQLVVDSLKEEMSMDSLPELHRTYKQMSSEWRVLSMACKLHETLPQQLADKPSKDSLAMRIFNLLVDSLAPKKFFASVTDCAEWEHRVDRSVAVLAQAMLLTAEPQQATHMWHKIITLKLFVKHVVLPANDKLKMSSKVFVLWKMMKDDFDLKKVDALELIERFLLKCNQKASESLLKKTYCVGLACKKLATNPIVLPCKHILCNKCFEDWRGIQRHDCPECSKKWPADWQPKVTDLKRGPVRDYKSYREKCNTFFMELVSQLCFSQDEPPSDEVIERLMRYVTKEIKTDETHIMLASQNFSALPDTSIDCMPVVRSFILQMLLQYNMDLVRRHLEAYVRQSERVLVNPEASQQLQVLITVCLQDHFQKQIAEATSEEAKLNLVRRFLHRCQEAKGPEHTALARAALDELAKWIATVVNEQRHISQQNELVLEAAAALCQQNSVHGPRSYLLKQIVRRFSFDLVLRTMRVAQLLWLLPADMLINRDNEGQPDRFLVCGNAYAELRNKIAQFCLDSDPSPLEEAFQQNNRPDILLLCLHRSVTQLHRNADAGMRPPAQAINSLCEMINRHGLLPDYPHLNGLLRNELPGLLHCEQNQAVSGLTQLAMHLHAVLAVIGDTPPVSFALRIPARSFRITECPKGHVYVIGNVSTIHPSRDCLHQILFHQCGRPTTTSKCKECGAPIGGTNHRPLAGNTQARGNDATMPGHILGAAQERPDVETPNLSAIIPNVQQVPAFLEAHLQHDVRQLQAALGCGPDDVFLLLHCIVHHMRGSAAQGHDFDLRDKAARGKWEEAFCTAFINPVVKSKDVCLQTANRAMANDQQLSQGPLMKILYEVDDNEPQMQVLWKFRGNITVQSLLQQLHERTSDADELQLLRLFLSKIDILASIRHLPNITFLMERLRHRYSYTLSRAESLKKTVRQIKKDLWPLANIEELLESFACAWNAVRKHLANYIVEGRLLVPFELCQMQVTPDTPLAMLLASDRGMGGCALGLVHFLCAQQNEFLETYSRISKRRSPDSLPVSAATFCHLISLDPPRDLFPILMAYQSYSVHNTLNTDYDFHSLQQKILQRFVADRELLRFEESAVVFVEDYTSSSLFTQLAAIVPQVPLPADDSEKLLSNFWELPDLCSLIGLLDIAMAFLVSIGGRTDTLLTEFIGDTLRMQRQIRNSTVEKCQLRHVEHLWRLLSMQKAHLMSSLKEDPFENLSAEFKEPITNDMKKEIFAFMKTNERQQWDIAQMLFNYMVITLIPQSSDDATGKDYPLSDCLMNTLIYEDDTFTNLVDTFPEGLLNKHLASAWTVIVSYINNPSH